MKQIWKSLLKRNIFYIFIDGDNRYEITGKLNII